MPVKLSNQVGVQHVKSSESFASSEIEGEFNEIQSPSNHGLPGCFITKLFCRDAIAASGASCFSEFRGRVMLLDFWASWCSPCLADIPQLKDAYQKYHASGFEIIGMDSETLGQKEIDPEFAKEAQIKAREIVSTRGVSWTQSTADSSLPIAAGSFGIGNLPAKILIDRSGKVVARIKSVSELDELLPGLLSAQP